MARQSTLSSAAQSVMRGRHHQAKGLHSDTEAASTESQQMLAAGTLLRKQKTDDQEVQRFRAKVAADQKHLNALLKQRVRQSEEDEARRRNEIASIILNGLKSCNQSARDSKPTFDGTAVAENAQYMPATNVIAASEQLIKEYERLDKLARDMHDEQKGPIVEAWDEELKGTEKQLTLGARVALRKVKKVLGVDLEDHENGLMGKDRDEEVERAEEEEKELSFELQRSLRYVERGVKRMIKGLPMDEDE